MPRTWDVYIAHAPGEDALAERLAGPIEAVGYTVHHRGTVLVGDAYHEEVAKVLDRGGPVIVCATIQAMGTGWAHEVVNAVKGTHGSDRIFPVRMQAEAYTRFLISDGVRVADCSGNFDVGIKELLAALKLKFPIEAVLSVVKPACNLAPWLTALIDQVGYIEITGIGSGVGLTREASRYPIEQLYTTLRSRNESTADDVQSLAGSGRSPTMAGLLSRHSRLLIEGQPGAGKTTFLHLVATMFARDILGITCPDGATWRHQYLGSDTAKPPLVPLFLKLSELVLVLEKDLQASGDDRCRLLALLDSTAGAEPGLPWRKYWEGILEGGEAILLLDGLDEVADERLRLRVFAIFRDACRHWGKCPIVVTSRPTSVATVKQMGFHHAVIEPFGEREINAFIGRWVAALHNLPIGCRPEGVAGAKAARILAAVLDRPPIQKLATNPVMLTCLCVVHWNEGELPEGRARLYRAVIRWLIAARSRQRSEAGFTDRFAYEAFAALALVMMGGSKGTKIAIIDLEHAAEAIVPLVERHFRQVRALPGAREWLRFECLWSGIVEVRAGGRIGFWHLTFQEYLAAQELAWRGDGETPADWWPVIRERFYNFQWWETVELLPGALFDEGGARRVDLFLNRVESLVDGASGLVQQVQAFGILDRLLAPLVAYYYSPRAEIEARREALRNRILPIFSPEGAAKVEVKLRIAAAEALGRSGDPRLTRDTLIELPGTGGVRLGKYLVTVQEFNAFVEAGGYDEPRYWSDEGRRWRTEERWTTPYCWEQQIEHPNRPVTGVSWYEAEAWCHWRSAETGQTVRLPTEREWQAAAAPDGREYPWGSEEPNPERANFDNAVGSPTPVGVYPAGNGLYGHCDLAGNVWEWAAGSNSTVNDDDGIKDNDRKIFLRGGAWYGWQDYLRATYRLWFPADGRVPVIGFRVAADPVKAEKP